MDKFCGWIKNISILKSCAILLGEDGDLPVFIELGTDEIWTEYKDVFFKELRKTSRQVFIILHKHDETIENFAIK